MVRVTKNLSHKQINKQWYPNFSNQLLIINSRRNRLKNKWRIWKQICKLTKKLSKTYSKDNNSRIKKVLLIPCSLNSNKLSSHFKENTLINNSKYNVWHSKEMRLNRNCTKCGALLRTECNNSLRILWLKTRFKAWKNNWQNRGQLSFTRSTCLHRGSKPTLNCLVWLHPQTRWNKIEHWLLVLEKLKSRMLISWIQLGQHYLQASRCLIKKGKGIKMRSLNEI